MAERQHLIVLAHSMGGLAARVWMGLLGRWPWCRALITLGTPHRGAPKALNWLVNGVLLKGPTEMLRGWPSVVQLLPRYPAVRDSAVAARDAALYPFELPVPWLSARAKAAYDLHVSIEKVWRDMPRRGPATVACVGWTGFRSGQARPSPNRISSWSMDYGQADGWPATQAALDEHREILNSLEFRTTLHALAGLYPAHPS